jgi:hypothetical protein
MYFKHLLLIGLFSLLALTSKAQTNETGGWLFLSHTQKITDKFDILTDLQLRTADQYTFWKNVLSRTALNYNLSKKHSIAVGYAYLGEWEKSDEGKEYTREHRIYQQYQYAFKHKKKEFTLRGRFEQRFIKEEKVLLSQRARVFASIQAPLIANDDFSSGLYVKFQDELFINVQHKDNVNGSLFDQNRPYGALGFRASKKLDFEVGYMRLFQLETDEDINRDIMQVMISTSF